MFTSKSITAVRALARHTSGNFTIMFAIMSPIVVMALAGAIDYSRAVTTKTEMQAALDASVLAGIKASQPGTQAAAIAVATNFFAADMGGASTGVTPAFSFSASGNLSGSATSQFQTLFGGILGTPTMTVTVASTADAPAAAASSQVCILLLSSTASPGLLANSGATVNAPTCEIDVVSKAIPAATFNAGTTITASKICINGTKILKNGGTETTLSTGCATATNPYVGQLPAPPSTTCSGANAYGGNFSGSVTLSPGVYCGWFNFNNAPKVTLLPGVYVIKGGGWNVDGGSWVGSGVTFYFADSSNIQYNSGMNMTISAPSTGTYAGILFYEPDGLSNSAFVFDDSVSESMSGLIYLPSRNITFNSTSNLSSPQVTLIANTAILDGMNWNLTPSSTWTIFNSSSSSSSMATLAQ